jgi:thiopeptide-type bacteriocin biosynthesis protein
MTAKAAPLFRSCGTALLRAAVESPAAGPTGWPDPVDPDACRYWVRDQWSRTSLRDAVRVASPGFAAALDAIVADADPSPKKVVRAATSLTRYVLRAGARHTPFGLFAGVAPVELSDAARAHWGDQHRRIARMDTQWLADVVDRLESVPELCERLDVVFTDLAVERGRRVDVPRGPARVSVRLTPAVRFVQRAASRPVQFTDLAERVTAAFPAAHDPGGSGSRVRALLIALVGEGLLITCLRAPMTVTDPLAHLVEHLVKHGGVGGSGEVPVAVSNTVVELRAVQADLARHNQTATTVAEQTRIRASITTRTRSLSRAGRTPVAVDLGLDCAITVPEHVAREMERAATALIRLTRHPTGDAPWRQYYTAFCERYGTGTVVPVRDVVHPDAGIGLPHGYPGSVLPAPRSGPSARDAALLALAWTAVQHGNDEIVLTDDQIDSLSLVEPGRQLLVAPHVELAARVHATSTTALNRGDYLLSVTPGRSAGTFTSRFTTTSAEMDTGVWTGALRSVYAVVPTAVAGAWAVQLSFPPAFPHAENVCRVPAHLPDVLSLGEHRPCDPGGGRVLGVDDLGVTASRHGLLLVSVADRRVVEPQVFHGLALDKQPPPLARFLIHLPRGLGALWQRFDWGPHTDVLTYLPRVRHGRAILAAARWRLGSDDPPAALATDTEWRQALTRWRRHHRCPEVVELRDADQTLRLALTEPMHAAILRRHLEKRGSAVLTEPVGDAELGWIGGHAHDVVLPLTATTPPLRSPVSAVAPVTTNAAHGQLPAAPETAWVNAKVFTHPERLDSLIAEHLPELLADLDRPGRPGDALGEVCWFIRYRSPTETDHLRLRVRCTRAGGFAGTAAAIGAWAERLRRAAVIGRLALDTYRPETGRYGHGCAWHAAQDVFVADSRLVTAQLHLLPEQVIARDALVAVNMVATVHGFLADPDGHPDPAAAAHWLTTRPAPGAIAAPERGVRDAVLRLAATPGDLPEVRGWNDTLTRLWHERARALAAYRREFSETDPDEVLESLLHMHHNRLAGIDSDRERANRRLARHAALAWTVRHRHTELR